MRRPFSRSSRRVFQTTKIAIDSIRIRAIRGIRSQELPISGKNLTLKGENGSGKSSFVDALDYFFTGHLSYFRGEQELSLKRHLPHKDFDINDISVELTFEACKTSMKRTSTAKLKRVPKELKEYFQAASSGQFILRRGQILKFIDAKPAEKYDAIAELIGLSRIELIEQKMRQFARNLKLKRAEKIYNIKECYERITGIFGVEVSKKSEVLSNVNLKLEEYGLSKIVSIDELSDRIRDLMVSEIFGSGVDQHLRLRVIYETARNPILRKHILEKMQAANGKVEKFISNRERKKLLLLEPFLEHGQKVLSQAEFERCPLCEQSVNRDDLLVSIEKKLKELRLELEEDSQLTQDISESLACISDSTEQITTFQENIASFDSFTEFKGVSQDLIERLRSYTKKSEDVRILEKKFDLDEIKKILSQRDKMFRRVLSTVSGLLEEKTSSNRLKKRLDLASELTQTKAHLDHISRLEKERSKLSRLHKVAKILSSSFTTTKKEKVGEVLASIQNDVNSFYSLLHPDDPHKAIELRMDPKRPSSTKVTIESFGGFREGPRALISEGHRDSLGLCIFLAFKRKFHRECSLIVLDDVVTTIDRQHRSKICELLEQEFGDCQIIITTHDEIWYEQIMRMCSNFMPIEIQGWTRENGPIISSFQPRWERIGEKLLVGDKEAAGNASRQYLEWFLAKLGETVLATVPIRESNRYGMNELTISVRSRLKKLLKEGTNKDNILSKLDKIVKTSFMVNLLSHHNPIMSQFSIKEIEDFSKCIREFHKSFSCPDCGRLLKYYQERKRICCPNPKCTSTFEILCK